ncbi:hypothetical protein ACFQ3W_11445 [Paenibacillus puldeungensis]|uniref:Uncharacterized protein n=1 Tax=Paenibacillus puldeungensis TaxID=696536 RepID=A0ABW3RXP6_9BACL
MRKKNKTPPLTLPLDLTQPERCQGCIWGRLEGTKQFCSLPRCVVDELAAQRR